MKHVEMTKAFNFALNNTSYIYDKSAKSKILENMMKSALSGYSNNEISNFVTSEMSVIEKFTPDYYYYA